MLNTGNSSNHSCWSNVVRLILPVPIALAGIIACSSTSESSIGDVAPGAGNSDGDQPASKSEKKSERERVIGQVTSVHESTQFVVIRSTYGRVRLPVGHPLEARGTDGVRTTLRLSPEHNPTFLCADYQENPPRVGDLVFRLAPIDDGNLEDAAEMEILPPMFSDRD